MKQPLATEMVVQFRGKVSQSGRQTDKFGGFERKDDYPFTIIKVWKRCYTLKHQRSMSQVRKWKVSERTPNLSKLSIAILESLVEPIIGDKAISEIKAPLIEKELREKITEALQRVETRVVATYSDRQFCEALNALPISNLPEVISSARGFFENPADAKFGEFLKFKLVSYYPAHDRANIEKGVDFFTNILREELLVLSDDIRTKLSTLATLNIDTNIAQIAKSVETVLNYILDQPSIKPQEIKTGLSNRIKLTRRNDNSFVYETYEKVVGIGRAPNNDIILDGPDVSWYHGYIENITGKLLYRHLSNTNPTIVRRHNQEYLLSKPRLTNIMLQNNDRIVIGKVALILEFDIKAGPAGYITTEKDDGYL